MKNVKILVVVAIVGVIGYFVFLQVSWGLFCMKSKEELDALARVPSPDAILALPAKIKDDAAHYHIPVDNVTSETVIEARTLKGDALLYFLVLTVHNGSKSVKIDDHQIENQGLLLDPANRKRLKDGGVVFKGCGPD